MRFEKDKKNKTIIKFKVDTEKFKYSNETLRERGFKNIELMGMYAALGPFFNKNVLTSEFQCHIDIMLIPISWNGGYKREITYRYHPLTSWFNLMIAFHSMERIVSSRFIHLEDDNVLITVSSTPLPNKAISESIIIKKDTDFYLPLKPRQQMLDFYRTLNQVDRNGDFKDWTEDQFKAKLSRFISIIRP